MIAIKKLQYTYQGAERPALANIDLDVQTNSLFGLLGPNGAGKTTLLSILSGLLSCHAGSVFVEGNDIAVGDNRWKKHLSSVPQDYAFYSQLTVGENLSFFGTAHGLNKAVLKSRLEEVMEIAGLNERLTQRATTLSGGLKRRLNLAIGLLNRPHLLLLDEPTVGVDPHSRHFILETIKQINQQGTTVIYTSHYMEEVEALCDQIAIIDGGKVLVQGSLPELLAAQTEQLLKVDLQQIPDAAQLKDFGHGFSFQQQQHRLLVKVSSDKEATAALPALQSQFQITRIHYGRRNLEELFLDLTQRSLRD
ncbi:MAG: ABC transporter ATP-binding protein [Gammaproteobacteria bacterium]|nr:MAG: ABC transporter ATP-binding protein [Gammaproteobacteria bacterium]